MSRLAEQKLALQRPIGTRGAERKINGSAWLPDKQRVDGKRSIWLRDSEPFETRESA